MAYLWEELQESRQYGSLRSLYLLENASHVLEVILRRELSLMCCNSSFAEFLDSLVSIMVRFSTSM